MNGTHMSILDLGYLVCQFFRIVDGYKEQIMYKSPVSAALIQHPELGNILYDTGNSPFYSTVYGAHINEVYPVGKFISIEEGLKAKGLGCGDIDTLIISHLHFDHSGGLRYFKDSKAIKNVIVSKADLLEACAQTYGGDKHSAYVKELFDVPGAVYKLIEGEIEMAPDITLFTQKSHTPGVIGLIIKNTSAGNVILTSDTIYTRENFERRVPPGGGINKNSEDFYSNIDYIKALKEKYKAQLLFGHDSQQIAEWIARGEI